MSTSHVSDGTIPAGLQAAGPHTAGPHTAGPHTAGPHPADPPTEDSRDRGPRAESARDLGPRTEDSSTPGPHPAGRRTGWHRLLITELRHVSGDAVAVTLEVPEALRELFTYRPGDHVVVRHHRAGTELCRSYSVCPPPDDPTALRLVIRRGAADGFGAHATTALAAGDVLELSPPTGGFALAGRPGGHHVLIAGGSGITPLAAMAAAALREDSDCRVSLIHSVPTSADALLADELAALKDAFVDRFTVLYNLTREEHAGGLPGGRIDEVRLPRLLTAVGARPDADTAFALCGPGGLVVAMRRALIAWGADPALIRAESFTAADTPEHGTTPATRSTPSRPATAPHPTGVTTPHPTRVTALIGGRRRLATTGPEDTTVLDALLRTHPDVPYACREGVCGSCRARVLSGRVTTGPQHALDAAELAAGYTLVCRARPAGTELTLDFDA